MTENEQLTIANLIIAITVYRQLQEPRRVMGLENLEPERARHAAAMAEAEARLDSAITRAMVLTNAQPDPLSWTEMEQLIKGGNARFDAYFAEMEAREKTSTSTHQIPFGLLQWRERQNHKRATRKLEPTASPVEATPVPPAPTPRPLDFNE